MPKIGNRPQLILQNGRLLDPQIRVPQGEKCAQEVLDEQFDFSRLSRPQQFRLLEEVGCKDPEDRWGDRDLARFLDRKIDTGFSTAVRLFEELGAAAVGLGLRLVEGPWPGKPFQQVEFRGTAKELVDAAAAIGLTLEVRSHLYTRDEHAVLTNYLDAFPEEAKAALHCRPYSYDGAVMRILRQDCDRGDCDPAYLAAVAQIALRTVWKALPNFAAWSEETGVLLARPSELPYPDGSRKLHLMPQHLLTINWANSAPGYSWPEAYYACRLPLYERYIVTVSADCPEAFGGQTDKALGSFPVSANFHESVKAIISLDWEERFLEYEQRRWKYVLEGGLVSEADAEQWADEVWLRSDKDDSE
jgi:hypothetical protein